MSSNDSCGFKEDLCCWLYFVESCGRATPFFLPPSGWPGFRRLQPGRRPNGGNYMSMAALRFASETIAPAERERWTWPRRCQSSMNAVWQDLYLHQQSVLDRPTDRHGFARLPDRDIHPMRLFDDQGSAAVGLDDIAVHLTDEGNIGHAAGNRVGLR